ncbi:hypothetical protein FB45DRAFT_1130630 [Roridomyces roridus]|uniref:F-box domain-containing protein n=1 Tax=Roridomyces roridus TaxID=1738132 RepID=A0AAD7B1M8_9AGAR|nr:hypothetical protein FB45DRAFT_1130630 [Roridomyces roridus]
MQAKMQTLLSERDALDDCIQKHTSVLSAVRRIPPEVWAEIFAQISCTRRVGTHTIYSPPWVLGHICRSWRDSALSNPFLWCSIDISRPPQVPLAYTHPLPMVETQILRSADRSLQVSVDWWDKIDADPFQMTLLDLLIKQSYRWRTFRAKLMTRDSSILTQLQGMRGRIPKLRRFELINTRNVYSTIEEESILEDAPSLREVILADSASCFASTRFAVPWAQITCCRGIFDTELQLSILFTATNLLCLDDGRLLNHITAPTLEDLRLEGQLDPALPFIKRSSCPLTRLILDGGWTDDSSNILLRVLHSLPTLQTLIIDRYAGTHAPRFWDALTLSFPCSSGVPNSPNLAAHDLCPDLAFLACRWRRGDASEEWSIDSFFDMLRSRRQPASNRTLKTSGRTIFAGELQGLDLEYLSAATSEEFMKRCRAEHYDY